jgi:hypothetical protein
VPAPLTRLRFLRAAIGGAAAAALAAPRTVAAAVTVPRLVDIRVRNAGAPYEGDRPLFATISPEVPGRDTAVVSFELLRAAHVTLEVLRTSLRQRVVVSTVTADLQPGKRTLTWTPAYGTAVGTYVLRLIVEAGGARRIYGGQRPIVPGRSSAPVVRVLAVEASCDRRSYAPGDLLRLTILADARELTLQNLHCGPEPEYTDKANEMSGLPAGPAISLPWSRSRSAPRQVRVRLGDDWPTGVYTAALTTDDGRIGFAPYVVRPKRLGTVRQAVVVPTNTWQAYNFYDADGDGFGDTWYAGGNPPVVLTRPYREQGVPPRFHRYDAPFLRWLAATGRSPEFITDDDLELIRSGDELRSLYDFVAFPGHTEYETAHVYDVVQRFRDLGGRMIFLSANAFFWRVDRTPGQLHRVKLWRNLGRPEAALLGAQYRANDNGTRQGVYQVVGADAVPWLFEGTDLENGSTFGSTVGGYGIEVDARTRDSPPGTVLVARIPDIFGPGITAEMTYYETRAGARVFNAGTLDFAGSVLTYPISRMLDNLWQHMVDRS